MKKSFRVLTYVLLVTLLVVGCGKKLENVDLSVNEIADKLYAGFNEGELPALMRVEITSENIESFLGIDKLDIKEGIASEPAMTSSAHSVVVVKVKDNVNVEKTKKEIKEKVNPAKWICVDAENVEVLSKGNVIVLVMTDETETATFDKIKENFKEIK